MYARLIPLLLAVPAAAQSLLPAPVRAVGDRIPVTAAAGLQPEGEGLLGGGRDYRVRFSPTGVRYDAALGAQVPTTRFLALQPEVLRRGEAVVGRPMTAAPTANGLAVHYERGDGLRECFDVRPDGLALSWQLARRPAGAGDLVVRYAVTTNLPAPTPRGDGLAFVDVHGGITVGGVTGIDARGAVAAGQLTFRDGGLELSLPAAFVDAAAYPLVIDPVLGTELAISTGLTYADGDPDVAYDAPNGRWLVVWRRTFAATDSDVRGQRVFANGQINGTTIFFNSSGAVTPPKVASLGNSDRFGVVWSQYVAATTTSQVCFQGLEPVAAALDALTVIDTTTTSVHGAADIGSDPDAYTNSGTGACVVWEDEDFDAIRMTRVSYFTGGVSLSGQVALWIDGLLGPLYQDPALSRACSPDGDLLLVVRRSSPLTGASAIEARTLRIDGSLMGIASTIATSSSSNLAAPDADGYGGRWVVAHERQASGGSYDAVVVTPVQDGGFTTITVGAPVVFGGQLLTRAAHPTVGYGPGRSWIGFQQTSMLPTPTTSLRVAAVDSGSCTNCNDTFIASTQGGTRIVVATTVSGGDTSRETCLATWHASLDDVSAQQLQNHGTSGTTVDLGGACGNAGNVVFPHAPGIGSSAFVCRLSNIAPTTIAAIFNFAPVGPAQSCGACVWTPFSVTLTPPNAGGLFNVPITIPCLPALVGSQFETQWTTIDPTQAPCPVFPGLSLSSRTLLTIGQ